MSKPRTESATPGAPPTLPVVRVFGSVGIEDVEGPISVGGPRQRRLLALLALRSGTVVDIDWLAEYLWDDDDRPETTAPTLRTYVSRLRATFPNDVRDWIATEPEGYRLAAPPDAIEHLRFTRLRAAAAEAREHGDPQSAQALLSEALALWRGEPFRELADLEPAEAEIERLRLDRLDMMEERWEAALALGRHTQITGELGAFAAEHGERDRAVRQYALALHRGGRTTEALRVVREHRRVLVDEFGLDPSAEITELERQLLDDDPVLATERDGRTLRGYRLEEEIGAGSFAVVWRGTQPSVGREVAIKQIRRELATQPAFIRRFEAEAHLVARIEHPHIVPLIDYWRDPDSAYLVMRWLRGGTLERRLDDGPLTLAETLTIARQIGGALGAAHAHGVIHRDVKTANILYDESGNAFLTDFGIALEATESSGPEAALSPGSPAYSSPEQIRQELLSPASDVFSLGVVLYECLAGTLPFGGISAPDELVDRQLHEPYPRLSDLRSDVPEGLSEAIDRATAKGPTERFADADALVAAIEASIGSDRVETALTPEPPDATENPYLGLVAFDDADADRFFGRERLVAELVERLSGNGTGSRCLVIVGPSGSGKSSVARAGLIPALREGAVPGSGEWFTTTMTPDDDPFESLEAALLRVAVNPPATLLDQLRDGRRGLLRSVRRCLPDEGQRLLLVIDQLEELFVGRSAQDADEFLEALAVAVGDPSTPLRVVATLRADYYGQPLEHPAFASVLDVGAVNVTPLAGDELERAIVEPAKGLGVEYEPGLVARIAAETAGQPSPLPLLQFTLAELFRRREERLLTAAAYEGIGGLTGALSSRADALYRDGDSDQRAATRRVFGRLIDPAEQSADLRRRARVADLEGDDATQWVLDRFGSARLITFDHDPASREPTVEVAHEALLREWPRLGRWLQEDREVLQAVDAIASAATRWSQGGRAHEDLLRGARLERARELVDTAATRLRPLDLDFVTASLEAAQAEQAAADRGRRRLRLLGGAVGVALVVAVIAGGLALLQQSRADEEARAAALAQGQAELLTLLRRSESTDPTTGILLALEAQRRAPSDETDRALLAALERARGGRSTALFEPLASGPCTAIWPGWVSRDGMLLTTAVDGVAITRDLGSGETVERFAMPGEGCSDWFGDPVADRRYAVSQASDRLWLGPFEGPWEREVRLDGRSWVSGADGLAGSRVLLEAPGGVSLVDSTSGSRIGVPLFGLDEDPVAVLSDDGAWLAIATPANSSNGRAGTIAVLHGDSGQELSRTPVDGAVTTLRFDDDRLLAGTADGRLISIDLAEPDAAPISWDMTEDPILDIDARGGNDVLLVVDSSPRAVVIVGPQGQRGPSAEIDGVDGAVLRPDGMVVSWDADRRVEVLDLDGEDLLAGSIELAPDEIDPDSWVGLDNGWAYIPSAAYRNGIAIELATGERHVPSLETPEGSSFQPSGNFFMLEDGHAAVGQEGDVGLWRDGAMVDRIDLIDEPDTGVDGAGSNGSHVLVGVRSGLVGGDFRAHLLQLTDDRIAQLFTVELPEPVWFGYPDGSGGMFVLSQDGTLRVYDGDGEVIHEEDLPFAADAGPGSFAFDGEDRVAFFQPSSVGGSTRIDVIDWGAGEASSAIAPVDVANLGFARHGEVLVLQAWDGSVHLHDLDAGATSPSIWKGNGAAASPPWYDEATDTIWVASSDRLAELSLGREAWRERACARVGRDLDQADWDRLVPGGGNRVPICSTEIVTPGAQD